jgi:hypothetical protein
MGVVVMIHIREEHTEKSLAAGQILGEGLTPDQQQV